MLVDANVLLFAVDSASPFHGRAKPWLEAALNGSRRVALAWPVLSAFLRIGTHARALQRPLTPVEAWSYVDDWLAAPSAWVVAPTEGHAAVFRSLVTAYDLRGNMVSDAHLAAIAIEHGLTVCSADTDFARFAEIDWLNPLA